VARKLKGATGGPMPAFVDPALATLVSSPPAGDQWIHETKFDGYRFQLHVTQAGVRFFTRRGHDWTGRAPKLALAA
jgi:bifunctional non-homologous end joining protein LigD